MTLTYQAGSDLDLPHVVIVPLNPTHDPNRHDLIARWIEFWCQTNCNNEWTVVENRSYNKAHTCTIEVKFENDFDAMLFKLSPEYDLR